MSIIILLRIPLSGWVYRMYTFRFGKCFHLAHLCFQEGALKTVLKIRNYSSKEGKSRAAVSKNVLTLRNTGTNYKLLHCVVSIEVRYMYAGVATYAHAHEHAYAHIEKTIPTAAVGPKPSSEDHIALMLECSVPSVAHPSVGNPAIFRSLCTLSHSSNIFCLRLIFPLPHAKRSRQRRRVRGIYTRDTLVCVTITWTVGGSVYQNTKQRGEGRCICTKKQYGSKTRRDKRQVEWQIRCSSSCCTRHTPS